MSKRVFKTFIFSEDVKALVLGNVKPTGISIGYFLRIGNKFYRVLGGNPSAGTYGVTQFQERYDSGKVVQGYRFDAQEIKNEDTLALLNENRIPCLHLNPKNIKEV